MSEEDITKAMDHEYKLGAGAARRRKYLHNPEDKIHTVMKEFERGTLMSGGGERVSNYKQAIAIAMSEAHKNKK